MNVVPTEKTIFLEAAEIGAPADRAAFLDRACAGDLPLRAAVEALLASHQRSQGLLDATLAPFQTVSERPGAMIGPYKLLQQIGEGGMGVVYMAEQHAPVKRKVALKVIKPGMDTRQVIARFEAERQALALMDHPNIAKVFDAGATDSGRPYFVMELVRGVPITAYCDDNNLTVRERLELFASVCQAIQHAHTKGIIHRDIKPTNVLVTRQDGKPVVKVIDFGVAKAIGQQLTDKTLFTDFAQMIGTPLYMSPEQAELTSVDIDTRSDIYSLGVLLYELLTGSTPVSKEQMKQAAFDELRRLIREEEPQKPSTRISGSGTLASIAAQRHIEPARLSKLVRGELDWIVMKALEKDRNRRYETANGFAQDVQRYLADEPVLACPPSSAYRFRKFARRNKAALATVSLVVLAILASVAVLAVSNVRIRKETQAKEFALEQAKVNLTEAKKQEKRARANARRAAEQTKIAQANEITAKVNEELARRRYYAAQMNLAMQAWQAGDVPRVLELLEGQRPKNVKEDLRGFEWFYLWRLCNGGRIHLKGHTDAVLSLSYSPDGKTIASTGSDETIRLWDTATGHEQMVLRKLAPWDLIFSPDGQMLACGGKTTPEVTLWKAATGELIHKIPATINGLAFSPDSRTLFGGGLSTRLWDVTSGAERDSFPDEAGVMVGMLPDGKTVVTLADQFTERGEARFWNAETGERTLTIPLSEAVTAELSPDGSRLATAARWSVKVWDTADGTLKTVHAAKCDARGLAFSPDGKRLASGYEDRRVVIHDVETGEQLGEDVHRNVVWDVAFSPDGKTVASATLGGDIKLWDMTPPAETVSVPIGGVADLRFSPDGRALLVGNSGPTSIVDVSTGKEVALLPFSSVRATSANGGVAARLSGDGQAEFWDLNSGREIARLPWPTSVDGRSGVTLSPSGTQAVAFISWIGDRKVTLWNIDTQETQTLSSDVQDMNVNCAEFSPDGKLLATGFHFQRVIVWDVATGKVKLQFAQPPAMMEILSLAFSPDSNALAVGTDIGAVTLWDIATGQRIAAFRGHTSDVNALGFSPNGEVLATAGADNTVKLWDARTGQERSTFTGHTGQITKVLFSPDGNTLATASHNDGTVKLWRAATDPEAVAPRAQSAASTGADSLVLPRGAFELTEAGLRDAVRLYPDHAGFRQRLGRLLLGQSRPADAESSFQNVVRLQPDDDGGYLALAQVLRQQRKFAEAEEALREAIRLKPSRPWTHETLGFLLAEQKKFAEAEIAFREAVRLKPDLAKALYGLGEALQEQKKFNEALDPAREAVRLAPANPYARGRLGWVLLNLGQLNEAELEFREKVRLDPADAEGHVSMGRTLSRQKKLAEAIVPLREAIRLQPAHPWAHEVLGWAYMGQQLLPDAEAAFREQVRLNPESPSGHFGLGQALQKQKKSAEAIVPLREAVRLDPSNHQPRDMLGWALVQTGAFADAESEFREMIRLKPDLAVAHYGLGRALVDQKKFADAELALREALRLEPDHPWAQQLIVQALTGQGKLAEAKALKDEPTPRAPDPVKQEDTE